MERRPVAPEQNRNDQRPACQAELQRDGNPGEHNRKAPRQDPERDPDEDRNDVRVVELLFLVAEDACEAFHGPLGSHDDESVAEMEMQVLVGENLHPRAVDARDVDAVVVRKVQVSNPLPVDGRVGDEEVLL